MKYTDKQRMQKIVSYTDKLISFIEEKKLTKEIILSDETIRWALTTPLYNIGEHCYYLSNEYKKEHMDIPWSKISGLRHRLVHDYEDTNWNIICNIVFDVLPVFREQLRGLEEEQAEE